MNQRMRPGAPAAMSETAAAEAANRQSLRADAVIQALTGAWTKGSAQLLTFKDNSALLRPGLATLALPPVLCALALLFAHGVEIQWAPAIFTLLASVLALAGVGTLASRQRSAGTDAVEDTWSQLRPAAPMPTDMTSARAARQRYANQLGLAQLGLAALCAIPVALRSGAAALLVVGLGLAVIALYAVDAVRSRIAPLDEIIAPLCLGPGLVSLTVIAQGQGMVGQDWPVAIAIGCMALAMIEGYSLRATASQQGRRTLATLLGQRGAVIVVGVALLVSYTLAVVISVAGPGLPGALLALTALPIALISLSGLVVSVYAPARAAAATGLAQAYGWYGLALAAGLTITVISQQITGAIVRAFGG